MAPIWKHTGFGWEGISFFTAAPVVLCFAFVIKTVFITYQWFSYFWAVLTQCQSFLCFSLCPQWEGCGEVRSPEGNAAGTADPNWLKGCSILYNVTLINKSGGDSWPRVDIAQGLAGHWVNRWTVAFTSLVLICFVFLGFCGCFSVLVWFSFTY